MTRFVSSPLALAAALSLSLTACGGDDKESSSTPAASTPAPSVTSPAPSGTPGEPVIRTAAELTKALLALSDLPSGFSQEKDEPDDLPLLHAELEHDRAHPVGELTGQPAEHLRVPVGELVGATLTNPNTALQCSYAA